MTELNIFEKTVGETKLDRLSAAFKGGVTPPPPHPQPELQPFPSNDRSPAACEYSRFSLPLAVFAG